MAFQVLASGGNDDEITSIGQRLVYATQLFAGVVVFAILVGFITDAVTSFMNDLNAGKTKVAELGHSLILGWGEPTPRLVVQVG